MPGANCSIASYDTSRKHKEISIFKIPKAKPGVPENQMERRSDVITRGRLIDSDLKRKTNEDRLHIYEQHFKKEEIEHCKLILLFQLVYV